MRASACRCAGPGRRWAPRYGSRGISHMVRLPALRTRRPRVGMLSATDGRDILVNSPDGWEYNQQWLWLTGPAGGDGNGPIFGNPPPDAFNNPQGYISLPAVTR